MYGYKYQKKNYLVFTVMKMTLKSFILSVQFTIFPCSVLKQNQRDSPPYIQCTSKNQISKQLCHPHRDKLEIPLGTTLQYQDRTRCFQEATYSKTCVKRPLSKRPKIGFQDLLFLIADQKYCRMLQGEHSAILLTFIKLPFVIKIFVLSFFEWSFYTGFTV